MNDELGDAKASVVSKLLVIAPYSAYGLIRSLNGVSKGKSPQQIRSANLKLAGPVCCALPTTPGNNKKIQVSKAVITSASFVHSGAEFDPHPHRNF